MQEQKVIPSNTVKTFRMANVFEHFIELLKDRYFWIIFLLAIVLGFLVYAPCYISGNIVIDMLYNIAFYRTIFLVAVAAAAWRYGTKLGLIACFTLTPVILISYVIEISAETSIFLDIGVMVLGVVISLLIGKHVKMQSLLDENTRKLRIKTIALSQEISEREKAEEEVRASEKRYRLLAENATDVIWTMDIKDMERLTYVSPSVFRLLGYSVKEALSKNIQDLLTPLSYEITMDTFQHEYEALSGKERSVPNPLTLEVEMKHRNGKILPVELNCNLYRESDGQSCGILVIARDISERKLVEEKLKHAAEEWCTTFDSITSLVSIHDTNHRIVRVNKAFAEAFNAKPEDLIGKKCYEVFHNLHEPIYGCPHAICMKSRKTENYELYVSEKDSYYNITTSPMYGKSGEVTGSVHIARDITERKHMEQRLILSDRLASIGELVSGVAHELNNPLTSIIGFSQLIKDGQAGDDLEEDLNIVYREAQRAANIVKNLLTFARKHAPVKQAGQINNVIIEVLKIRAYEQKVNNIMVNTEFGENLPEIMLDYFQMQQVFMNIIVNAENAMLSAHGRGTLNISTKRIDDTVIIEVADDGPGIEKKNIDRIFTPFFTTKEIGKGTGLGLSICHGIIKEHGGNIRVESELGKGASFIIELPVACVSEALNAS
jgi:PAS domain S-box-containing protein